MIAIHRRQIHPRLLLLMMPSLSIIARLLKTAIRGIDGGGRGGRRSTAGSPTVTGGGRSVRLLLLLLLVIAGGSPGSPILLSIGPWLIVGHLDLTLISAVFFVCKLILKAVCVCV